MSRQESFEQHYADQHDVPAETMIQYRWAEQDGYRLPGIAAAYRNYCAGWDAGAEQKNSTITQEFRRCMVCKKPEGHGGLPCPEMRLIGTVCTAEMSLPNYHGNKS